MYYIPEACWTGETGDTEESRKVESSTVGQWTRRLRLPNASRPNQRVLELSYKTQRKHHLWHHAHTNHTAKDSNTKKLTTWCYLPVDDSPGSFNCRKNTRNRTLPTFNTPISCTRTTGATLPYSLQKKLGIVAITREMKSSENLT